MPGWPARLPRHDETSARLPAPACGCGRRGASLRSLPDWTLQSISCLPQPPRAACAARARALRAHSAPRARRDSGTDLLRKNSWNACWHLFIRLGVRCRLIRPRRTPPRSERASHHCRRGLTIRHRSHFPFKYLNGVWFVAGLLTHPASRARRALRAPLSGLRLRPAARRRAGDPGRCPGARRAKRDGVSSLAPRRSTACR
jgi:hypothetical protein